MWVCWISSLCSYFFLSNLNYDFDIKFWESWRGQWDPEEGRKGWVTGKSLDQASKACEPSIDGDNWPLLAAFWVRPVIWPWRLSCFYLLQCSIQPGQMRSESILGGRSWAVVWTLEPLRFSRLLYDSTRTGIEEDWLRSSVRERLKVELTSKLRETIQGRTGYLLVTFYLCQPIYSYESAF